LRKASQFDIRLREAAGPKDIDIYYRLHLETYSRTAAKPHPLEYFQAIFEKFQPRGLARILFAERRGDVVAAQNTGRYKAGAVYWTGASISEKEGGENRLLFDAQIMAARDDGCARYETGQAFVNSTDAKELGLSRFKRSFGAEMHPFYRGVLHSKRRSFRLLWGLREMMQTVRGVP
jgi:lipid II:glycine glycyltransferase (peptidoglycan interpeptide bridge formation enzyme)